MSKIFMNKQRIGGFLFSIFSILYLVFIKDIPITDINLSFNARTFPYILGSIGLFISILLILKGSLKDVELSLSIHLPTVCFIIITMLLYTFLLPRIGFIIATTLFLNLCFIIMKEKNWRHMFYTSFSIVCIFWIVLTQVLKIYLSPGSWWIG